MRHNEADANMEAYSKYKVLYRNAFIKQETGLLNRTLVTTEHTGQTGDEIEQTSKANAI